MTHVNPTDLPETCERCGLPPGHHLIYTRGRHPSTASNDRLTRYTVDGREGLYHADSRICDAELEIREPIMAFGAAEGFRVVGTRPPKYTAKEGA